MKQHRFWAWGAVFCMLMCIYTASAASKARQRRPLPAVRRRGAFAAAVTGARGHAVTTPDGGTVRQ